MVQFLKYLIRGSDFFEHQKHLKVNCRGFENEVNFNSSEYTRFDSIWDFALKLIGAISFFSKIAHNRFITAVYRKNFTFKVRE